MHYNTDDVRIQSLRPLLPPAILMEEVPATADAMARVGNIRGNHTSWRLLRRGKLSRESASIVR